MAPALIAALMLAQAPAADPSLAKSIDAKIDRAYAAARKSASEPNLFELASALIGAAEYEESIKFFRFAIGKYPASARLRVGLGVALHGTGDYDAALQSLCEGADLDPKDARAMHFLGAMQGLSPAMSEQVTKRLAHYAAAYPDNAAAHHHYAMSYWRSRNGQESEEDLALVDRHLTRAAALDRRSTEIHLNLGTLRERQGRLMDAVRHFDMAVAFNPGNLTAWYRLSQALTKSGQTSRAGQAMDMYRLLREKKQKDEAAQTPK